MFNDHDNEWCENHDDGDNWKFSSGSMPSGPATSIDELRDSALRMFERYLSFRLKRPANVITVEDFDYCRRYLSLNETESIIKEFSCNADLVDEVPEGVFAIGARSVEELMQKTKEIYHALMSRIMSNLMNEGVNRGLIDCAFDSESNSFAFSPSKKGEKLIGKILAKRKTKNKKKKNDPDD